ncbi:hypothetical protein Acsp04_02020 [Actinomadura sp. NBRC 104425]|uniref:hypothetical protein n=1 Tax=Actinomadura sp. NBRC 104425 TaxID=3032204 RepID=UPI0024A4A78A|nr:hypothetical protein [Actinomadura sp. NBRC 104425]GLZ09967.1 hypothetical protein Acsp04_02020 [Actinomadura sp. NBRC 104425]
MTAVVLLGDVPSTQVIQGVSAARLPVADTPEGLLAFVDQMTYLLSRNGAVVAVYPAAEQPEIGRILRMARGLLKTDRIAGVPLELPPLALSLIADQLAFVARYVSPGIVAGIAAPLTQRIVAGAWVNSVAKLERVKTGIGQHVTSYLPGSGFMVTAAPTQGVHRVTSSKPVAELSQRPLDPVLLLAAHGNGDMDWLRGRLQPALGVSRLMLVQEQPRSAAYWGTKKYVEFVAFSGHPQELPLLLRSQPCVPCRWCGEMVMSGTCPFCGMVKPETAAEAGPPQPPQPPGGARPAPAQPAPGRPGATPPATPPTTPPAARPGTAPSAPSKPAHPGQPGAGGAPSAAPAKGTPPAEPAARPQEFPQPEPVLSAPVPGDYDLSTGRGPLAEQTLPDLPPVPRDAKPPSLRKAPAPPDGPNTPAAGPGPARPPDQAAPRRPPERHRQQPDQDHGPASEPADSPDPLRSDTVVFRPARRT